MSRPSPSKARRPASLARRRRALLELAQRHGEVRLRVTSQRRAVAGACEVSELLDQLNEDGLLRYGGLQGAADSRELVYLAL